MSVQQALAQLPERLRTDVARAYNRSGGARSYGVGSVMVDALMKRGGMDPTRALMAGLAMDPIGRGLFDDALDKYVNADSELPSEWPEVIVGGGAHAATWAATRVAASGVRPLVLERSRFGGTFAMTRQPSFFLNSRNRPGPIGTSGSRDALNVIPGAPMQPSDMSGSEYQANADLGLVVRCTLALNTEVRKAKVTQVVGNGSRWIVMTDRGSVATERVVIATGIGNTLFFQGAPYDNERLLSFKRFMRRFDRSMFPLRNLGRVAVVGAGDSGRTVVEALTGYGPYMGGSVASLDYVPQIDWYGVGKTMTKERWLECNRTRYKPLASLFQNNNGTVRNARVTGLERVTQLLKTPDGVQVNGNSYDTVVCCVGYSPPRNRWPTFDPGLEFNYFAAGAGDNDVLNSANMGVALGITNADRSVVVVGPAANIAFQDGADPQPRIEENRVALFRLAPRTATLASLLTTT